MTSPEVFKGYAALTAEDGKKHHTTPWEYKPPAWQEEFVDIEVQYCGLCATDAHMLHNGWGVSNYPMVPGHEIVGKVVRAGSKSGHKEGALVGVGFQSGSCLHCRYCSQGREQYCEKMYWTYNMPYPDGTISKGGYANYVRAFGNLSIPIPSNLDAAEAAPLLCAGVTVYSPLKRFGCGPGKKVAIVGIGGLGHIAIQIAVSLGAEVSVLSHSDKKKELVKSFGVAEDHFIPTANGYEDVIKNHTKEFDIILDTATGASPPVSQLFFPLAAPEGAVVLVGLPDEKIKEVHPFELVGKGLTLAGSIIGGSSDLKGVLDLASKGGVTPLIEKRPMSGVNQALEDLEAGKPRFRYVLEAGK